MDGRELSPLAFTITTLLVFLIGLWLVTFVRCIGALVSYHRAVRASKANSRSLFTDEPDYRPGLRDMSGKEVGSTPGRGYSLSDDRLDDISVTPADPASIAAPNVVQLELGPLAPNVPRKDAPTGGSSGGANSHECSHLVSSVLLDDDLD